MTGEIYFNKDDGFEYLIMSAAHGDAVGQKLLPEWTTLWRGKAVRQDQTFERVNLIQLFEMTRIHFDKLVRGDRGDCFGVDVNTIPATFRIVFGDKIESCKRMSRLEGPDGRVMIKFESKEDVVPNVVVEMDANEVFYGLADAMRGILKESDTVERISDLRGGEVVYNADNCEPLIVDSEEIEGMFADHPGEYIKCQRFETQIAELDVSKLIKREDCVNKDELADCDRADEVLATLQLPPCEDTRREGWQNIPRVIKAAAMGHLDAYDRFVEPDLEAETFEFEFESDSDGFDNYKLTPQKLRTGLNNLRIYLLNN